ncbi:tyrosine--tRNA ligase [Candidatus Parcubacteria bacterium]|nr:MAG: tyrosine--tRNA ligase [Candidatus Parcubacteria bacterium]
MNTNHSNKNQILIDSRRVDKIYPSKEAFIKAVSEGGKITVYNGIDPTASSLHLGHLAQMLFLKRFQALGHKVIFLVGDFTARVGDPTGRLSSRKVLSEKEIKENLKTYKQQASRVLSFSGKNPAKIEFNSRWLSKLKLGEFIKIAEKFTINQMIKRDMFQRRLKEGKEIHFNEFIYPLLQGYDSVALDTDAEVGGTDQTFNMLAGRDLVKIYKNKEKFVFATHLLVNPKTGQKLMSKSEGGYVSLDDKPDLMFGKIMALPDETLITCFKLCTEVPDGDISKIEKGLNNNEFNPRDIKARLAKEIITIIYGGKAAQRAEEQFDEIFRKKVPPKNSAVYKFGGGPEPSIMEVLVGSKIVSSRSAATRLIKGGAVDVDGKRWTDLKKKIPIPTNIRIGKHGFLRVEGSEK